MNWQLYLLLLPYLLSLALAGAIGLYAWRHSSVPGAKPFTFVLFGEVLSISAFIFELLSDDLGSKVFWDNIGFLGNFILPVGFLAFAQAYSGKRPRNPRLFWGVIILVQLCFTGLLFTDRLHGLIRPYAQLVSREPFTELLYPFTPLIWVMFIFNVGLMVASYTILTARLLQSRGMFRAQVLLVLIGTLVPFIGMTLTIIGITFTPLRDTSPFTFIISNLLIAIGLFRYQLFSIGPVAREVVIEDMRNSLFVLDNQDKVVDLNPAAETLTGLKSAEVIGKSASEVFKNWPELVSHVLGSEDTSTIITTGGESQRHYEVSISQLDDGFGRKTGKVFLVQNITRRVRIEQELHQRTSQLEAANKELEAFVYSVSHDLRAPLRGIDGYSKALLEDYQETLDDMGKAYLQYIRESSARMAALIDDLLRLSRITRSELHYTGVDLSELANEILSQLHKDHPERQVTIQVEPGMEIEADPSLMKILLQNLLENAWKFTSRHPSALIEVGKLAGSEEAIYYVRDDGAGFNMDYIEKLFIPFQRLHGVHEFEGSGVGLATVQRILLRHGGRAWAEGEIEKGATIYFTIP
jgi:PAS domain S-box-containing protein